MPSFPRLRAPLSAAAALALLTGGLSAPAALADEDPTTLDDLIISEYVEGSSNNKAIELYNGTSAPIDLSAYRLQQYSNGGTSAGLTLNPTGTLAPGGTYIIAHSSSVPELLAKADMTTGAGLFNGDDALVLRKGETVVDSFGQVGFDPGAEWGTGLVSTADNTLRRQADVCAGDTVPDDVFDPALEWDGFAVNTFDGLGSHTTTCGAGTPSDPDPVDPDPEPTPGCGEPATLIGAVQGSGETSPKVGQSTTVEGVVVGDFQHAGSYSGYYVQDAGDGNDKTSDGIFVYAPGGADVAVGDQVRVTGTVAEYFGMTQIALSTLEECGVGTMPEPTELTFPVDHEAYEGMLVNFAEDLAVLEYFNYGRYGQVVLGHGDGTFRQYQPTAVFEPGSAEAEALFVYNAEHRIMLDDGLNTQNPSFLRHPNGEAFTLENRFRGGDTVSDLTGVLDYRFNTWTVQPTEAATYQATNPRPAVPEVGGTTTVGSFNVLNYFTTLTSQDRNARGADTPEEFERQQAKIVAAINEMDTDVVGLIEIENNDDVAVAALVTALNAAAGEDRWAYVPTGSIGTDAITTALIYQPAEVTPVGDFAVLDATVDERFRDDFNRPALAQTFQDNSNEGLVTVVVNHLKSKGSSCSAVGDPTDPDGQGNCNGVRTEAADALGDWANGDPTGTGTDNVLIIGDLNSYDKEDPIQALMDDGYVDLLRAHVGEYAYSYVFDGMLGYLDYAMASTALADKVVGADAWLINADEPSVLDYDMSFKPDAQDALYAPDAYRSSDHDPVVVGLVLAPEPQPDTVAPELEVIASPDRIWPPNNKWVTVTTVVDATDDSGIAPGVTVVSATTNGKGEIIQEDASRFRVLAVKGAVYTITYEATDAAGNTTTESVTVRVDKPGKPGKPGRG